MTVTPPRNPEARKLAPLAHEIAQLAGELRPAERRARARSGAADPASELSARNLVPPPA